MAQLHGRQGARQGQRAANFLKAALLLDDLAGNEKRDLPGLLLPGNRAGARGVEKRNVARVEPRAAIVLLNVRAPGELKPV